MTDTNKAKEIVLSAGIVTIITHFNPDGDAVGSSLGFLRVMKNLGKETRVIVPNEFPDYLSWLPGQEEIINFSTNPADAVDFIKRSNLIVCLDFNSSGRMGNLFKEIENTTIPKLLIDHHPEPEPFCDIIISNTEVSSTAELVYDFFKTCQLESNIDKISATCLYTGILTDTVCFTVNASRPGTFLIAHELMLYGLNKDSIQQKVFDSYSVERMQLLGYCLNEKMVVLREYKTAYIWLTKEELSRYNFKPGDSEGFVNYPLSIQGIIFSALFMEKEDHIKLSFRSRGNFAVNEFMKKHFKGGGHVNAAGGEEYTLTLDQTLDKFESLLGNYQKELQNVSQ